jgi:hypothetical protein
MELESALASLLRGSECLESVLHWQSVLEDSKNIYGVSKDSDASPCEGMNYLFQGTACNVTND